MRRASRARQGLGVSSAATTQFFLGDPAAEDCGVATLYVDGDNIPARSSPAT